jgi:Protein of unknown function (DUF2877)
VTFSTARRGAGVLTEPPGLAVPVRGLRGLHGPPSPHRHPVIAGAASLGIRESIDLRRRPARVIAAFPSAVYLEVDTVAEPRVVAVVASDAVRLPSAVVIAATTRQVPFETVREGDSAMVGDGSIDITRRFQVRVRRWWDPTPVLGPISLARLAHGAAVLESVTAGARWGLTGHRDPRVLADCCAAGDLASAVDAAERIVGLGPGLTPSGDDALCGLLLALRLLGGAVPSPLASRHSARRMESGPANHGAHPHLQSGTSVWLADWIGAAVTAHAGDRTTSLAATLLHCAARGQASVEVAGVLRGIAGQEPVLPAVRRLLSTGHTSGADLAWGLLAGCRAALSLQDVP